MVAGHRRGRPGGPRESYAGRGPLLQPGEVGRAAYSRGDAAALDWWSSLTPTERGEVIRLFFYPQREVNR